MAGVAVRSKTPSARVRTRRYASLIHAALAIVGVGAACGLAWSLQAWPVPVGPSLPFWVFAVAFLVTEHLVVRLRQSRDVHTVSMTAVPLVVALLTLPPSAFLAARGAGAVAFAVSRRKRPLVVRLGIVGDQSMQGVVAVLAITLAPQGSDLLGPAGWLLAIAAAVAALTVRQAAEDLVNRSIGPRLTPRERLEAFGFSAAATLLNTALGMVIVYSIFVTWRAAFLGLLPAAVLYAVYQAYVSSRHERVRLKALYEAMRALHESAHVESALVASARHAKEMFDAQFCEILLDLGSEAKAYRTIVGPDDHVSAMESVDIRRWHDVWERAESSGEPFLHRPFTPMLSSAAERRLRITVAMVAPIQAGDRQAGIMVVANPVGEAGAFEKDDLDLLGSLAGHVGVAVENGRLEDSLVELTELKEELRHQALHDGLTGLANRTLFGEQVFHAIQRTRRTGHKVGVLFVDIDDFKDVNDSLGHAAGDELLQAVADRLRHSCRPEDSIARLGGDEFGVLLEDLSEPDDAVTVAERVLSGLGATFSIVGREVGANASIGIALATHGDTADQVLRDADAAMYAAKRAGKGRFRLFESAMHTEVVAQLQLRADLDAAIDRDQLDLRYQPIVELATGRIIGFESLLRWQHARKGWITPGSFIPFAEQTGLIHPIGRWALRASVRQCKEWQRMLGYSEEFEVTVNLSAKQLEDPLIVEAVGRALFEDRVDPGAVVIEITETAMMRADPARLEELKGLGVRLAIDDFGTGYSSLGWLHTLPVDILKIDRLFVEGLTDEHDASPFVSTIVGLSRQLGLDTIVEGIESAEQLDRLRELGCTIGQGFYFAEPLTAAQATALLDRQVRGAAAFDLDGLRNGHRNVPMLAVG